MKSDNVKAGMQQAPHRSLFNDLGFTEEEMKKRCKIRCCRSRWSTGCIPCNCSL